MRFFRTPDASIYESIRQQLDAAWGHPTPDGKTATCFDPVAVAPKDVSGRVLLAVKNEFCSYEAVAAVLPQLLASGAVEEISEAEYRAALPSLPTT